MKGKSKKSFRQYRHLNNTSFERSNQSQEDKIEKAKRQLEKYSSEQLLDLSFRNQIKIDDWTNQITKEIPNPQSSQGRRNYFHPSAIKNNKYQEKRALSYNRPQISFRSMKPVDGEDAMRKTLRRSNEDKIQAVRRIMSKTPLQHNKHYKRHFTTNQPTNLQTFRLLPQEKNYIFGRKYNYISLDPSILDKGKKRLQLKKKKLKQKNLSYIDSKIRQEMNRTHKMSDGHLYNQSQVFVKMGMLKPEISKLMDLIKQQEHNKINFNISKFKRKKQLQE